MSDEITNDSDGSIRARNIQFGIGNITNEDDSLRGGDNAAFGGAAATHGNAQNVGGDVTGNGEEESINQGSNHASHGKATYDGHPQFARSVVPSKIVGGDYTRISNYYQAKKPDQDAGALTKRGNTINVDKVIGNVYINGNPSTNPQDTRNVDEEVKDVDEADSPPPSPPPPSQDVDSSQPDSNDFEVTEVKIRSIDPQTNLHNDSVRSSDRLNRLIYAKAIAREIEDAQPPLTIGILAKWGSGKTHLLEQIKDAFKEQKQKETKLDEKNEKMKNNSSSYSLCLMIGFVILVAGAAFFATSCVVNPCLIISIGNNSIGTNQTCSTTTEQHGFGRDSILYLALVLLLILVPSIFLYFIWFINLRILFYATFTEIPQSKEEASVKNNDSTPITKDERKEETSVKNHDSTPITKDERKEETSVKNNDSTPTTKDERKEETSVKNHDSTPTTKDERKEETSVKNHDSTPNTKDERLIFVDFNAWEYAGSDNLWAAIVTNLASEIEKEFGVLTSRLLRLTGIKIKEKKESDKTLFFKFDNIEKVDEKNLVKLMKSYGIVKRYKKLSNEESSTTKSSNDWEFKFLKREGMQRAFEALKGKKNITITKNSAKDDRFPKKRCGFSKVGCWISLVVLLVAVIISAATSNFDLIKNKYNQADLFVIQVVMWISSILSFCGIAKFLSAACQSQTYKINKALKGAKTNMAEELGFMHKVKEEVQLMTKIVRCAEFVFNRKYRVVISIDDLDRVDLKKVKSVLDAVNILLSDKNSPFVCLIAVDSQVAVKSVEENMSSPLLQSNVTGHEYLKKIINLPFCLPEISDEEKKQFIQGMLAWRDKKVKKKVKKSQQDTDHSSIPGSSKNSTLISEPQKQTDIEKDNENPSFKKSKPLNNEEFIEECQKFLSNDPTTLSYLNGNPRNIKRIFNILCLTLRVIQHIDDQRKVKDFFRELTSTNESRNENGNQPSDNVVSFLPTNQVSRDLTTWVILTDQWPYSMSYILHVIDKDQNDHETNIKESVNLLDIYEEHVQPELLTLAEEYNKDESLPKEALMQDRNQDDFPKYLKKLKDGNETNLNKEKASLLRKITINLDQSYLQMVQSHSNFVSIKRNLQKKQETEKSLLSFSSSPN